MSNTYKSRENNILRPYLPTTRLNQLSIFETYLVSSVYIIPPKKEISKKCFKTLLNGVHISFISDKFLSALV